MPLFHQHKHQYQHYRISKHEDYDHLQSEQGVYALYCPKIEGVYIGNTINLYNRWFYHDGALRNDSHFNSRLQKAFNRYGVDAFYCVRLTQRESEVDEADFIRLYARSKVHTVFNVTHHDGYEDRIEPISPPKPPKSKKPRKRTPFTSRDKIVTFNEAAKILGVSQVKLHRMLKNGNTSLPGRCLNKRDYLSYRCSKFLLMEYRKEYLS